MVILYNGAFCRYPEGDQIIMTAAGGDWVSVVEAAGLTPEKYSRYAFDEGKTYVDFGCWSKFIVMIDD